MNNTILIDERQCGSGKTRPTNNNSSIIGDLNRAYQLGYSSLVVVPTINLMNEYNELIQEFVNPESGHVKLINSDVSNNTMRDLVSFMMDPQVKIVVVTHVTWTRLPLNLQGITRDWQLFIDEAIQTTDLVRINRNDSEIEFNWQSAISCPNYTPSEEYQTVEIHSGYFDSHSLICDSSGMRKLKEPNRIASIRTDVWLSLQCGEEPNSWEVYLELDPEILSYWSRVRVAAARFSDTNMRLWMDKFNLTWTVIEGCEFKPHTSPIKIHVPASKAGQRRITWSKQKIMDRSPLLDDMCNYIQSIDNDQWLSLANRNQEVKFTNNQTQGTHCAHGVNSWRHHTQVVFHSALNPSTTYRQYLYQNTEYKPKGGVDPVFMSMCGYEFYQFVMRSAAREQQAIDVVVIDQRLVDVLLELWEPSAVELIEYNTPQYNESLTDDRSEPLTKKQMNRADYLKRKHQLTDMTHREVLKYMGELDSVVVSYTANSISPLKNKSTPSHSLITTRMADMRNQDLDQQAKKMDKSGVINSSLENMLRRIGRWMGD